MNNNPIGVMDSGIGGLTVFSRLVKVLSNENYIYFGDTKNMPYGSKTKNELIKLAKNIFDFYSKNKAKAVIMACNTTSATVYDELKDDYDFIIYPLIQTAAKCIAQLNISRIGILSTQATAESLTYTRELQKYKENLTVIEKGCPGWVQIVENQTTDSIESRKLIKEYLEFLTAQNVEKIVLGCTHYPYLLDILSSYADKDLFIDPAQYFVDYIKQDLTNRHLLSSIQCYKPKFIVSSDPEKFQKSSKLFYNIKNTPELVIPLVS